MTKKSWLLGLIGLLWSCGSTSVDGMGPSGGAASGGTTSGGTTSGGMTSGGTTSGGTTSGGTASGGTTSGGAASAGAAGTNGGTDHGGAASMADVQAFFDDRCVICHDKSKQGLPTFPQLSLVAGDARAALVGKAATEKCGGILVVPGDPDHSYLMKKLTQATPCEGMQMPRPFEIVKPPPTTAADLATLRSWIGAGANP
jgi:hypothetical protein